MRNIWGSPEAVPWNIDRRDIAGTFKAINNAFIGKDQISEDFM